MHDMIFTLQLRIPGNQHRPGAAIAEAIAEAASRIVYQDPVPKEGGVHTRDVSGYWGYYASNDSHRGMECIGEGCGMCEKGDSHD
jgi:hypothetical protein